MKVGTDGVLLGAWADAEHAKTILDIGTGTGVIALMLAQRTGNDSHIDAVEIEESAFDQARENLLQSPWPEKISIYHTSIQNFQAGDNYDLIISNPPYFQNSQKPPDSKRLLTRHTDKLSFTDLITSVKRLLTNDGKFNVILPNQEGLIFVDLALNDKLYCTRQWSFRTRRDKPVERWLLEFSLIPHEKEEGEIVLYEHGEKWTDGYKDLTKHFYLKL